MINEGEPPKQGRSGQVGVSPRGSVVAQRRSTRFIHQDRGDVSQNDNPQLFQPNCATATDPQLYVPRTTPQSAFF